MIDRGLDTLKWSLSSRGYDDDDVRTILLLAKDEMTDGIKALIESCVQEIVDNANSMESDDFLSQVKLISENGYVQISTDSGLTDFSKPAIPMLSSILKNGKTSKDGSIYKVVPIGKNPFNKQDNKLIKNTDAGIKALSSVSREGKSLEQTTVDMAVSFGMAASSMISSKKDSSSLQDNSISFRTASSNQDPNSSWVIPRKEENMTNLVYEINNKIRYGTDDIIENVVRKYEREY